MEVIAETPEKTFAAITIDQPSFSAPFEGVLYPCLIWDHDGGFTHVERRAVAKTLLEAGCRYAVCGGLNCEAWHDAVDIEFVERHLHDAEDVRDAVHVMTTWHEGESPDDVAFFFVLNTNFDYHDFGRYLVLHVGGGPAKAQLDAAVRKYAINDAAV
jgi:hypothetical protein